MSTHSIAAERDGAVVARLRAAFARIEALEPTLRAFVALDRDGALARGAALDRLPPAAWGPLHGLPFAVKEVIDRKGRPAAWGAQAKAGRVGAADAAVVTLLEAAGAVAVGETVSTEYAIAAIGPTRNPHDPALSPGASSSGSGAAVGAGALPFALATQTIGSIIRPAAYCGAVGYKPRRSAIDRAGVMPLSPRLDAVGFIAESLTMAERVAAALGLALEGAPSGRVVRIEPWFETALHPETERALAAAETALRRAGWELETRAAPEIVARLERGATETILAYEAARLHGAELDRAPELLSERLRALLRRGRAVTDAAYYTALTEAAAIEEALRAILPEGAAALAPATIGPPPRFGAGTGEREPQRLWTLVDWPALTVPALWSGGLPFGAQLLARPGEDAVAFRAAEIIAASAAALPPA